MADKTKKRRIKNTSVTVPKPCRCPVNENPCPVRVDEGSRNCPCDKADMVCGPLCKCKGLCKNRSGAMYQVKKLKVVHTGKKGYGLFATTVLKKGHGIVENVGKDLALLTQLGADRKAVKLNQVPSEETPEYIFVSLEDDTVLDATSEGNVARFINHSCSPNVEALRT